MDDRLERADVIDPDGVEQHGHFTWVMGEIDENAPSEANFDERTRIVKVQDSVQVTANSGALSGLDKGGGPARGRQHAGTGKGPSIRIRKRQSRTSDA
jgi:hypothetical protein